MKAKPQAENSHELNLTISSWNNAAHYCKVRHKFMPLQSCGFFLKSEKITVRFNIYKIT